jgi:hypothetical protein
MYEEPVERRIGKAEWKHWAGTPGDLAEIAQLGLDLVSRDGRTGLVKIEVAAPAFEATFARPDQVRQGLKPEDLPSITEVTIKADDITGGAGRRRIAVTIERPKRVQQGIGSTMEPAAPVKLVVTAEDRDWVDLATLRMKERLDEGARATARVQTVLLVALVIFVACAGAVVSIYGDEAKGLNAGEIVSIVLFSLGGLMLLAFVSTSAITPQLELFPEGETTKWVQLRRRVDFSGRWLLDTALKAAVGAAVVLLIDHLG